MRIYTRGGDKGKTALVGGSRRWKSDSRVEAYGAIDEAGAFIGWSIALLNETNNDVRHTLQELQQFLWDVGADLAKVSLNEGEYRTTQEAVDFLETNIDRFQEMLSPRQKFVLRGGAQAASSLHVACTVIRRAERRMVELMQSEEINETALHLVNRASDLLFVLALLVNERSEIQEIDYERSPEVFR